MKPANSVRWTSQAVELKIHRTSNAVTMAVLKTEETTGKSGRTSGTAGQPPENKNVVKASSVHRGRLS